MPCFTENAGKSFGGRANSARQTPSLDLIERKEQWKEDGKGGERRGGNG